MDIESLVQYLPDNSQLMAKLNDDVLDNLNKCIRKSRHLKNKIKKFFDKVLGG
jgi:hypothetical protein